MNRRRFLTTCAITLPSLSLITKPSVATITRASTTAHQNLLLGGGSFFDKTSNQMHRFLSLVDIAKPQQTRVATTFLPHGIHQNPTARTQVAAFEKIGSGAAIIDIEKKTVSHQLKPTRNRLFYGHGAFTVDGKQLFSTESAITSGTGAIGIRSASTFQYEGEFPSYGHEPHECKLIDDGRILVVANAGDRMHKGEAPCICFIDIASQMLLEKKPLDQQTFNAGHFALDKQGTLVTISAPRKGLPNTALGGVSFSSTQAKDGLMAATQPETKRMEGESLSIAISNQYHIAGITHPQGNFVSFWSLKSRHIISTINLTNPRGIALSANEDVFFISFDHTADLLIVPITDLNKQASKRFQYSFFTGSHIYNYSNALAELLSPGPLF